MAKDTFGSGIGMAEGINEEMTGIEVKFGETAVLPPKEERAITSKFVSDGVYKYVYVDTGEDYKP